MADSKNLLLLGAAGVAAWWFFFRTPPAPVVAAPSPSVPDPNAITGANTVAGIYGQLVTQAKAPAAGLSVDEWGYTLNQILAPMGKVAPDPMSVFPAAVPGFDRAQKLTAGQYWAVMAPALKTQLGLSGFGYFGGMGMYGVVQ